MSRRIAFTLAAAVAAAGGWSLLHHRVADAGDQLVTNRIWIDHLPKSNTDPVQLFALVEDSAMGLFDARSQWKGEWEVFRYRHDGEGKLALEFPQSGARRGAAYRASECKEKNFNYCLELSAGRGASRYYSRKGWEIGARSADEAARAVFATLAPPPQQP
jgi:hypothetical protein